MPELTFDAITDRHTVAVDAVAEYHAVRVAIPAADVEIFYTPDEARRLAAGLLAAAASAEGAAS